MDRLLSPKQVALAIGSSESSLKRWCDQGLLHTVRTAGGHRRIPVQEALRFVRERNLEVAEPLLLAMVPSTERKARRIENAAGQFVDALMADNEHACRALIMEHFQSGVSVSRICDEIIAPAFHTLGEKWECHEVEIYEERSSCLTTLRLLNELREKQVPPTSTRFAMGATLEGDHYSIPATMAEIVLRSTGWNTRLLGCSIPAASLMSAIEQHEPAIFWLSVSHITDTSRVVSEINQLFEVALKHRTAVVAGGRALSSEIRSKLRYSAFCDTMQHLAEFSRTLQQHSAGVNPASPA